MSANPVSSSSEVTRTFARTNTTTSFRLAALKISMPPVDSQVRALFGNTCAKPAGAAALRKLVGRLQTVAHLPIPPDLVVLRSTIANAFALPGGRIYVLSGLLKISETTDELAGVLSHELGRVAHRDGLRRLIRDGGTSFLVGLMFGDVTGSGAVLIAARSVLSASNSRDDETGADRFAVSIMHGLGRPTAPLGVLLERVSGPGRLEAPSILRVRLLGLSLSSLEAEEAERERQVSLSL
jgi:Zn-dependent protease with chaperone function